MNWIKNRSAYAVAALALFLLCETVQGQARRARQRGEEDVRVVVEEFHGTRGDHLRSLLVRDLEQNGFSVIPEAEVERARRQVRGSGNEAYVALARALRAEAFIEGRVGRARRRWVLSVRVRNAADGEMLGGTSWGGRTQGAMDAIGRTGSERLWDYLGNARAPGTGLATSVGRGPTAPAREEPSESEAEADAPEPESEPEPEPRRPARTDDDGEDSSSSRRSSPRRARADDDDEDSSSSRRRSRRADDDDEDSSSSRRRSRRVDDDDEGSSSSRRRSRRRVDDDDDDSGRSRRRSRDPEECDPDEEDCEEPEDEDLFECDPDDLDCDEEQCDEDDRDCRRYRRDPEEFRYDSMRFSLSGGFAWRSLSTTATVYGVRRQGPGSTDDPGRYTIPEQREFRSGGIGAPELGGELELYPGAFERQTFPFIGGILSLRHTIGQVASGPCEQDALCVPTGSVLININQLDFQAGLRIRYRFGRNRRDLMAVIEGVYNFSAFNFDVATLSQLRFDAITPSMEYHTMGVGLGFEYGLIPRALFLNARFDYRIPLGLGAATRAVWGRQSVLESSWLLGLELKHDAYWIERGMFVSLRLEYSQFTTRFRGQVAPLDEQECIGANGQAGCEYWEDNRLWEIWPVTPGAVNPEDAANLIGGIRTPVTDHYFRWGIYIGYAFR